MTSRILLLLLGLGSFGCSDLARSPDAPPEDASPAIEDGAEDGDTGPGNAEFVGLIHETFPQRLSALGISPEMPDLVRTPSNVVHYEPTWPLYSDGSTKQRHVFLPPGRSIDKSDPELWQFPVGTLFFKTFSYADLKNSRGRRHIETRLIHRSERRWQYAVYRWAPDMSDARLINIDSPTRVSVAKAENTTFEHEIPSRLECRMCHEAGPNTILGYNAWQLGERALGAPDAITAEVMGYALGNCTQCHNGSASARSSFDLRPEAFWANTVNQPTGSSASGTGIRVVPGSPEDSVLFLGLSGGDRVRGIKAMPPLGVQVVDTDAVALFRKWIEGLTTPATGQYKLRDHAALSAHRVPNDRRRKG